LKYVILINYKNLKMEMKKKYEQPSITTVGMENPLMETFSGNAGTGTNNGPVGDAKGNNFFYDDDEEEKQ
jgi:hypothetical protein